MGYSQRLRERQAALGRPVRIALVGAGQMGLGFVTQVSRVDGMQVVAIADALPGRAEQAYRTAGTTGVVSGGDHDKLVQAVLEGRPVAVDTAQEATELPVDMVVDATGVPSVGAEIALRALLSGKDVGTLNVECDVTVGHLLSLVARSAGRVYTVCRGDEPVEAKRLVEYARDLAFEVICAGKGKNNPLDPQATPARLKAEADSKHMNPKMLTSFVDGSKAMIEMAALANGTGLELSRRGMNGPAATVPTLHDVFRLQADGGILDRPGVVDYCTGPVAPGVFVVVRSDDPAVIAELDYLKLGSGPYFSLYRPYHLASIEAPLSVAEAVIDGRPSLAPVAWKAEVAAAAKRDLAPGEVVDGIGGETIYGVADNAAEAHADGLVPLGLLAGARVVRPVAQDALVTYDDIEIDGTTTIASLRKIQETLLLAGRDGRSGVLDLASVAAHAVG